MQHTSNRGELSAPAWMRYTLLAAALYNLLWGAWVISAPLSAFELAGLEPPRWPEIWQCVGMIVGVYGVGYAIAAFDPLRHWPIVLVGLLGKVLGPIGMIEAVLAGRVPVHALWVNVTNDFIWLVPFGLILLRAWQSARDQSSTALAQAPRPTP